MFKVEAPVATKPNDIPEDLESSPDIEDRVLGGISTSVTKESLDFESSPDVEEKILKITNSMTKESLNNQSGSDIEEKLLERSTSIIKQSFDLDSSPEIENKIIEIDNVVDIETNIDEVMKEDKIEVNEIDSSPDIETKIIDTKIIEDEDNEIPPLLLENLVDNDSSPDLEDQKMIDISASIIPECSETEQSPELEDKQIKIEGKSDKKSPQEKSVKDIRETEKKELESEKKFVEIPQSRFIIKEISISNENLEDKENNPLPPPRKKKPRALSLSRSPEISGNIAKRSLSLGPKERKPRRQIKETWEGNNAMVRVKKRSRLSPEIELSDKDSVETHSDDTSLCYTKSPHAVLKRRLRAVTADRARLEHVLAGFEEQNRRLQYELADALHAARTQREISTQLAKQLAKAQKGK